ncbi:MAG: hypothetical protein ACRC0U_09110 [Vibrio sp.]
MEPFPKVVLQQQDTDEHMFFANMHDIAACGGELISRIYRQRNDEIRFQPI